MDDAVLEDHVIIRESHLCDSQIEPRDPLEITECQQDPATGEEAPHREAAPTGLGEDLGEQWQQQQFAVLQQAANAIFQGSRRPTQPDQHGQEQPRGNQ